MLVDNRFEVRIISKGDKYGLNNVLTHEADEQLVEFWDTKHSQFVSRYYVETLLSHKGGLNLHGGVPEWEISASGMAEVVEYLKENQ